MDGVVAKPPRPNLSRLSQGRLDRLQAEMRTQQVDVAVLLHGPHVTYATGFVPDAMDAGHVTYHRAVAIVPAAGPARLHVHPTVDTDTSSLDALQGEPLWPELDEGMDQFVLALQRSIGSVDGKRIAVDSITGAMHRAGVFDGADLSDATRVLGPVRLCKTADEIACIEHAQHINERAMEKFVEEIVSSLPAAPDTYDTIRLVNSGRLAPPEDEIDVLDVGRNQCAATTSLG